MTAIWEWFLTNREVIVTIVVATYIFARAIISLTPTLADDTWLARIKVWLSYIPGVVIPADKAKAVAHTKLMMKHRGVAKAARAVEKEHAEAVADKKRLKKTL